MFSHFQFYQQEFLSLFIEWLLNELDDLPQYKSRFKFIPYAYEDSVPAQVGQGAQTIVDNYLLKPDTADIFICSLWHRMGTPTLDKINPDTGMPYQSGTEYEFLAAYRACQINPQKPLILLYRCERPPVEDWKAFFSNKVQQEQYDRVEAFFARFKEGGDLKGLYSSFSTNEEFEKLLRRDLITLIEKHQDVLGDLKPSVILPQTEGASMRKMVATHVLPLSGKGIPILESEFSGRKKELEQLNAIWHNPQTRLMMISGWGGMGKTSLMRQWIKRLTTDGLSPQGIFWWNFNQYPDVDAFFSASLSYLTDNRHDVSRTPSEYARAQALAAMLSAGQFLFVLDGLESLQSASGTDFAQIKNDNLRDWLTLCASLPGDTSKCLIASRFPFPQFDKDPSYREILLNSLSPVEGRELLVNLGVKGSENALMMVITRYGCHPLTLTLIGTLLVEYYDGKLDGLKDLPPISQQSEEWDRVLEIIQQYIRYLSEAERDFLNILSLWTMPIPEDALDIVCGRTNTNSSLGSLSVLKFKEMLKKLIRQRLVYRDSETGGITMHAVLRRYFFESLIISDRDAILAHSQDYLTGLPIPEKPSDVRQLEPVLEQIRQLCLAGYQDQAYKLYRQQIKRGNRWILTWQLGAYATELDLMRLFFKESDVNNSLLVTGKDTGSIFYSLGVGYEATGQLQQALNAYQRAVIADTENKDSDYIPKDHLSVASVNLLLGDIEAAFSAVQTAVSTSQSDTYRLRNALYFLGRLYHIQGEIKKARAIFTDPNVKMTVSFRQDLLRIFRYDEALCLLDRGLPNEALHIAEQEYENVQKKPKERCMFARLRGLALLELEQIASASTFLNESVQLAQATGHVIEIAWSHLACGCLATVQGLYPAAQEHLKTTLHLASLSGSRLVEMDAYANLSMLYLAQGMTTDAKSYAEHLATLSYALKYPWGNLRAARLLAELSEQSGNTAEANSYRQQADQIYALLMPQ